MNRGALDGVELEYEVVGNGEPVVLIHAGIFADWFTRSEPFVLPDATHLLQVEHPRDMAEGLAAFFARHLLARSL